MVSLTHKMQGLLARLPRPAARWSRLFGLGVLVGVFGGLAAAWLERGLHYGTHWLVGSLSGLDLAGVGTFKFSWAILLLPALGGLLSGIVVWWLCPDTMGRHGTDALTEAFHRGMGDLPLKAPAIKGVAAVGVISCGGSAGPEGPIAAIGAGLGSTIGRLFSLTPQERRILLLAGCAAGVGAIFQCPLGGAIFATSLLYREEEFESDAMVPSFVASVIGYTTFMTLKGGLGSMEPLLPGGKDLAFSDAKQLIPYALLGPLCGLAAVFFSVCLHFVEHRLVLKSPLPKWLMPGIGGLATGGLACLLPQVMDGQYAFIRGAINAFDGLDQMASSGWWRWAGFFAAVVLAKCIATSFTVGSGASGGVLGPSVFIGGVVGAFLGAACEAAYPAFPEPLRQSLIPVGMGGVLAATMRTPLASIVMVTEMTGSYGLIVPLMLVCMSAYVVGRRWGLNREQVRTSAESPAHAGDAIVHMLETWKVEQIMEPAWKDTVSPNTPLPTLVERIKPGTRPVFAVAKDGLLLGIISVPDIRRIMEEPGLAEAVIAMDIMTEQLETVFPDIDMYQALNEFKRGNHQVLPVVSRDHGHRWLGMLDRERIFAAIRENLAETQKLMFREHVGLTAIEQEGQLQNLVMGVAPKGRDMIQRLLVPMDAVGRSLRDADFRRRYGAQVIAVEHPDGTVECPPKLDEPLRTGQRLMAVVWYDSPVMSEPKGGEIDPS
ncbi:MAG: chloride channel protein [Phycisphaerales bacterium]|nr:chloride channel protein [Phycisphaerales bacterium]